MEVKYNVYQFGRPTCNPKTYNIKIHLSDSVDFTIMHIRRSLGLSGRKLKINGKSIPTNSKSKLSEYFKSGAKKTLEIESFSNPKKNCFEVTLTVTEPMAKKEYMYCLDVQHSTTVEELRHQVQNVVGVSIQEQQLFVKGAENSKRPAQLKERVVSCYKHGCKGLELVLQRHQSLGIYVTSM